MDKKLVAMVLSYLITTCAREHTDLCPTAQDTALTLGLDQGVVKTIYGRLASAGVLDWPADPGYRRRNVPRLRLPVPAVIPVVGTFPDPPSPPGSFTPGEKFVEVWPDGRVYIVTSRSRVAGRVCLL